MMYATHLFFKRIYSTCVEPFPLFRYPSNATSSNINVDLPDASNANLVKVSQIWLCPSPRGPSHLMLIRPRVILRCNLTKLLKPAPRNFQKFSINGVFGPSGLLQTLGVLIHVHERKTIGLINEYKSRSSVYKQGLK